MDTASSLESEEATGIATVAALMAHPTRAAMLSALVGGERRTAGQLATLAGVSPATASEHLARLTEGGLLAVEARGRFRYFRLSHLGVAQALEAVAVLVPPVPATTSRGGPTPPLRRARSCYDHLAGEVGVAVTDALQAQGALALEERAFRLTADGEKRFAALGVDVLAARGRKRQFAPACLDWTERRFHLAGSLGAALLQRLLDDGWVARTRDGRALRVTVAGQRALQREFGIELPRL